MILLGQRRENAYPRVCASGCTDGDIRGASVKASFVWTRLLICDRDLTIDKRRKKRLRLCVVIGLLYGAVCRANLQFCQNVGCHVRCGCLATAYATSIVCFKPIFPIRCVYAVKSKLG
jgi:hypothetical protein